MRYLLLALMSFSIIATQAQELDDIVAGITEELELSEAQSGELKELMTVYRGEVDRTLAKYDDQEEPDVSAMIGDIRGVRDEYRKKLGGVLSKDQMKGYTAMIDGIIGGMFTDIAEIRLLDLQDPLELSDEQVTKLAPVMGSGLKDVVQILFENADTRLGLAKKVSIGNQLKKIQKRTDNGAKEIMTSGQFEKWQAMKEAAKNEG